MATHVMSRIEAMRELRARAVAARECGCPEDAFALFAECLHSCESISGQESRYAGRELAAFLFLLLIDIGALASEAGRWEIAVRCCDAAFEGFDARDPSVDAESLARGLALCARALDRSGRSAEAVPVFEDALARLSEAGSASEQVSATLLDQATALGRLGRFMDALRATEKAFLLRHGAAQADPAGWEVAHRLAEVYRVQGDLLSAAGRIESALRSFAAARSVWNDLVNVRGHSELGRHLADVERAITHTKRTGESCRRAADDHPPHRSPGDAFPTPWSSLRIGEAAT